MASILGLDCKMYRNEGTYDSPNWVEILNVRDVKISRQKAKADVSVRGSSVRLERGTLKTYTITTQMVYDPEQEDWQAFNDAFEDGDGIELAVADGDIAQNGTRYLRALFDVFSFDEDQSLEAAVMNDVEFGPTYDAENLPTWYTVGA